MRNLRAALGAVGLSLVVTAPAAAQATYHYVGCNLQGTCGTATLFMYAASDPGQSYPLLVAPVTWSDGVGGALFGPFGARIVGPPSMFSFSDYMHTCYYGFLLRPVTSCTGMWAPDFTTLPIDFVAQAIEINVGYGMDELGRPISTGLLTLTLTPEPATVALLGGGLLALGGVGVVRRRNHGA